MTFILPSFGASAISAVPASGGGGGSLTNTYSVDFDGTNDYLDTGSNFGSTFQSDYTISTWFKRNETSATAWLFGHDYRVGGKHILKAYYTSSAIVFNFQIASASATASFSYTADTNWHHLVVSASQSGGSVVIKIYLDGVYKNTGSVTASLSNYVNPVAFIFAGGNDGSSVFSHSNAKQDEIAIFGSALSDGSVSTGQTAGGDIATLYGSGSPSNISSLSPVAWYRMGDNDSGTGTTITDQGSGGNDASLVNGPVFSNNVPVAPLNNTYSLDFDGSDDHAITTASPVDMSDMANGYTFSTWMWREDDPNLASNGGTLDWLGGPCASADTSFNYPYLRWYLTDEYYGGNSLQYFLWYHGNQQMGNYSLTTPKGQWCHLVATWDGNTTVTLYLDGAQVYQKTNAPSSLPSRADRFMIGKGAFMNEGKVDEAAYWNRGLSASDITAIYNSGVPTDLSSYSPVGWWRCGDNDGGTGTTVTDQGSGGNDMSVNNGATFSTSVPS